MWPPIIPGGAGEKCGLLAQRLEGLLVVHPGIDFICVVVVCDGATQMTKGHAPTHEQRRNLPGSRTKRTQGRNNPVQGNPSL